jgi:asparagine synthase (glutamine-hydrolysing)
VAMLPDIVYKMDEPMGDAINLPMYMLSREAKKKVSVILTGEGGDEIFGGYLFHKVMWMGNLYKTLFPRLIRQGVIQPLLSVSPAKAMNLAFQYPAYLGNRGKLKAMDYLNLLEPEQLDQAYRHLISLFDWRDTDTLYTKDFHHRLYTEQSNNHHVSHFLTTNGPYLNRLLRLQFEHWLPENMLMRQDRTGMAHSIEGRVPFLDHTLVEFALRLPPHLKLRRLTGKYILRLLAKKILPEKVAQRKKMPFYVPIENYFQQPDFRDMMEDLVGDDAIRKRGLFQPEAVRELRAGMNRKEFLFVKQVFSLMILELWFRIYVDQKT